MRYFIDYKFGDVFIESANDYVTGSISVRYGPALGICQIDHFMLKDLENGQDIDISCEYILSSEVYNAIETDLLRYCREVVREDKEMNNAA